MPTSAYYHPQQQPVLIPQSRLAIAEVPERYVAQQISLLDDRPNAIVIDATARRIAYTKRRLQMKLGVQRSQFCTKLIGPTHVFCITHIDFLLIHNSTASANACTGTT